MFPRTNIDTVTSPLGGNYDTTTTPPIVIIRPHPLIVSVTDRKSTVVVVNDDEGAAGGTSDSPSHDEEDVDTNIKYYKQHPGRGRIFVICPYCGGWFSTFHTTCSRCGTFHRIRNSSSSINSSGSCCRSKNPNNNMSNLVGDFSDDDDDDVLNGGTPRVGYTSSSSSTVVVENGVVSDSNCFFGILREVWESSELIFNNKLNWLLILGPIALFGDATGVLGEAACFAFSGIALIPCAERYVNSHGPGTRHTHPCDPHARLVSIVIPPALMIPFLFFTTRRHVDQTMYCHYNTQSFVRYRTGC